MHFDRHHFSCRRVLPKRVEKRGDLLMLLFAGEMTKKSPRTLMSDGPPTVLLSVPKMSLSIASWSASPRSHWKLPHFQVTRVVLRCGKRPLHARL